MALRCHALQHRSSGLQGKNQQPVAGPRHGPSLVCSGRSPSSRLQRLQCRVFETVGEVMTQGVVHTCAPSDTVDSALEQLVTHRVTGLPVVDEAGKVVGVVSDYDLLALDTLGKVQKDDMLFPAAEQTWQAFNEVKKLLAKSSGKRIVDVMTATPITVRPETNLEEAAKLLLVKKIHRLPVVDGKGKLVGVLSRGNIIKAALELRKATATAEELGRV